ncbi:hypothetical protein BKA93DRAFT_366518 [Sparassis latifolia]
MKFARYLEDTQIPEWKKAYIDYRGLKKRITAIRRAQTAVQPPCGGTSTTGATPIIEPTESHDAENPLGPSITQRMILRRNSQRTMSPTTFLANKYQRFQHGHHSAAQLQALGLVYTPLLPCAVVTQHFPSWRVARRKLSTCHISPISLVHSNGILRRLLRLWSSFHDWRLLIAPILTRWMRSLTRLRVSTASVNKN